MKKKKEYTSIRLTKETVKRLQSRGKFNDSYESIIRTLLDRTDSGTSSWIQWRKSWLKWRG